MKYKVLTRDFRTKDPAKQFALTEIDKPTIEDALDEVDAIDTGNMTQNWLLTGAEYKALKEVLQCIKQ